MHSIQPQSFMKHIAVRMFRPCNTGPWAAFWVKVLAADRELNELFRDESNALLAMLAPSYATGGIVWP